MKYNVLNEFLSTFFYPKRELFARNGSLDISGNFGFNTSPAVTGFVDLS